MKKTVMLAAGCLMMGLCFMNVRDADAARKQKNISLKAGETKQIQLDSKGSKEKVKFTFSVTKVATTKPSQYDLPDYPVYDYTTVATVTINGKVVDREKFVAIRGFEPKEDSVKLVISDLNTKDKVKDIFLSSDTGDWCGKYNFIRHMQYNKGKVSKDDVLKTLKNVKTPKANPNLGEDIMEANLIESRVGLVGEFVTTGNGYMDWNVCLGLNKIGHAHGSVKVQLKGTKIKLVNASPSGKIDVCGCGAWINNKSTNKVKFAKAIKVYQDTNKKKTAFTVKVGEQVSMSEFKYVNKKAYLKIVNAKKKEGWIAAADLEYDTMAQLGTLHA